MNSCRFPELSAPPFGWLANGEQVRAVWSDLADLGRAGKAVLPEDVQNSGDAVRAAGNQEAAAGLRVGEERLGFGREVRRQGDVVTVGRPSAAWVKLPLGCQPRSKVDCPVVADVLRD